MKKNKGFTLIEMIVVISTIALSLPILFSIVFTILQQQTKIYRLTEVKRQGDYVLNTMENLIKNYAASVHSSQPPSENNKICQWQNEQTINGYFLDKFGSYFRFCRSNTGSNCDADGNYIASFSSILNNGNSQTIPLNNDKVRISDFLLTCYQTNPYSPPVVGISFIIYYNTTSTRPEDKAQMTYQTKVKLRSY